MKIYLVTRSLSGVVGGVERQLGNIAFRLSQSNHDVSILSSDSESPEVFYTQLRRFPLLTYGQSIDQTTSINIQRLKRQTNFLQLIRHGKPDLIIAFMLSGYLVALPSAMFTRTAIVLAERNSPDVYELTRAKKHKAFYFQLMRISSGITVQLGSYKNRYPKFLQKKIRVIHNEIIVSGDSRNLFKTARPFTFGFVGRFSYQKQPIRLLESFARHIAAGHDSRLVFFGKGELEPEMVKAISLFHLEEYVTIHAPIKAIDDMYNSIDALCLPSLWEGFPNVVGEAMMYGLPTLGNKHCFGLKDLITSKVGLLIDFEDTGFDGFATLRAMFETNDQNKLEIMSHINRLQRFDFVKLWNQVTIDATQ
jgi:GalNAc-alpha-(1->4)-GalNAc-alpha-(1->3)-diNAcBac-PP-undecaprenol alpha-1,4-N-acetyl-D-galactosaminyltransferase